jgi:hypothetical protein
VPTQGPLLVDWSSAAAWVEALEPDTIMKMVTGSVGRGVFLAAVLALHFFTRLHGHLTTPLQERHYYPTSYLVSLSLITGNGFSYLLPRSVAASTALTSAIKATHPEGDPDGPLLDFISGTGREELSGPELAAYLASGAHPVAAPEWETSRVLDIYLTAALWKLLGIRWFVYFAFYALVSTLACLCVFLVARGVSGSYWCGLAGAIGFMASPLENYATIWSPRDTCPLWFAALAFVVLLRGTRSRPSQIIMGASSFAAGVASLVGLGWRPDALLIAFFMLVGLIGLLAAQGQPTGRVTMAVLCFVSGCLVVRLTISCLGPARNRQGAVVFHVAWYGEDPRSNLLGTENAFQVARDDMLTVYQSNYFGRQRGGLAYDSVPNLNPTDTSHFRRCLTMYVEMARYNAFSWWTQIPGFLLRASGADRPAILGSDVEGRRFLEQRPGWLQPLYRGVLDHYGAAIPFLFLIGLIVGLARNESRVPVLLLSLYFVYYAVALLLVLPESKHFSPLLFPLHVLSALGLWSALRSAYHWREWQGARRKWRPYWKPAWFGVLLLAWGLIAAGAYVVSWQQRRRFVDSIRLAAASGADAADSLKGKRLFSVRAAGDSPLPPVGYLLKVRGGSTPLDLFCQYVRAGSAHDPPLAYYTRHQLQPNREQFFFVNLVGGTQLGDDRPYAYMVTVRGGAQIVSSTRVNLSSWSLGLPLSFVFNDNDDHAGSSFVGRERPVTEFFIPSPEMEEFFRRRHQS